MDGIIIMAIIFLIETMFGNEKHLVELTDVPGTCGLYFLSIDRRYVGAINSTAKDIKLHIHSRSELLYADEIQILLDAAEDYRKIK